MSVSQKPLLEIRGLQTWYPIKKGLLARTVGHVRAVDGVSLDLHRGETLGLVGESGCGKSTLARTVLRLERPRSGHVRLNGQDVLALRGSALRNFRRTVQVVFQDPYNALSPRMTVEQIVGEGLALHFPNLSGGQRRDAIVAMLEEVGLQATALADWAAFAASYLALVAVEPLLTIALVRGSRRLGQAGWARLCLDERLTLGA